MAHEAAARQEGRRVRVIAGKDKGLEGKVIAVCPSGDKVIVGASTSSSGTPTGAAERPRRTTGWHRHPGGPDPRLQRDARRRMDGNEVATRVGYNRVEVHQAPPRRLDVHGFRSVRIARATGEEI